MVDKVKALKIEIGDSFPTETDPNEDFLSAKGISIEGNDSILIKAEAGVLGWQDLEQGTFKAFNSASGPNFSYHKILAGESVKIEQNQHMICLNMEIEGSLNIEGGLVFI